MRGPSDRDIESLIQEAGAGSSSKTCVCRVAVSWAIRYRLLCTRSGDYELVALFLADLVADRPSGPKEPSVAWGYTHRVLVSAQLGRRQTLIGWIWVTTISGVGCGTPWLVVSHLAPGLIKVMLRCRHGIAWLNPSASALRMPKPVLTRVSNCA